MHNHWTDVHAHLSDPRVDAPAAIEAALQLGIARIGLAGTNAADFRKQLELKKQFPQNIRTCAGLHPWFVKQDSLAQDLDEISKCISVSDWIGETGLDYSDRFSLEDRAAQMESFQKHLEFFQNSKKPLVLHIVRAHEPALNVLRKVAQISEMQTQNARPYFGFLHSFSGSAEQMHQYIQLGFKISFVGASFREGRSLSAFRACPPDQLFLESDCPDQGLDRHSPSQPADLLKIAQVACRLRDDFTNYVELLNQTAKNAEGLWNRN